VPGELPLDYLEAAYAVLAWEPKASFLVGALRRDNPNSVAVHLLTASHADRLLFEDRAAHHRKVASDSISSRTPRWEREQAELLLSMNELTDQQKVDALARYLKHQRPEDPLALDQLTWQLLIGPLPGETLAIRSHVLAVHPTWLTAGTLAESLSIANNSDSPQIQVADELRRTAEDARPHNAPAAHAGAHILGIRERHPDVVNTALAFIDHRYEQDFAAVAIGGMWRTLHLGFHAILAAALSLREDTLKDAAQFLTKNKYSGVLLSNPHIRALLARRNAPMPDGIWDRVIGVADRRLGSVPTGRIMKAFAYSAAARGKSERGATQLERMTRTVDERLNVRDDPVERAMKTMLNALSAFAEGSTDEASAMLVLPSSVTALRTLGMAEEEIVTCLLGYAGTDPETAFRLASDGNVTVQGPSATYANDNGLELGILASVAT
jgi:hypothetical protein